MIALELSGYESALLPRLTAVMSRQTSLSGTIAVRVVSADEVQTLNREYASTDEPTDVLSFSYRENDSATDEFGDIVISREHIARQATDAGTSEETELILLLMHGVLHIIGFDHQTADERQRLDKLQRELMQELGLDYRRFNWET